MVGVTDASGNSVTGSRIFQLLHLPNASQFFIKACEVCTVSNIIISAPKIRIKYF